MERLSWSGFDPSAFSPVIDVTTSHPSSIYFDSLHLDTLNSEMNTLRHKIGKTWRSKKTPSNKINYVDLRNFFVAISENEKEEKKKREDSLKIIPMVENLISLKEKAKNLNKKISKSRQKFKNCRSVFVTFKTRIHRNAFIKLLPHSRFDLSKYLTCCFKKKDLLLDGQRITAKHPPHPINISWSNLNKGTTNKILRRAVSLTVNFLLFFFRKTNF